MTMHDPAMETKLLHRADQIGSESGFPTMQPDTMVRRLWTGWQVRSETLDRDRPMWVLQRPEAAGPSEPGAARWAVVLAYQTRFRVRTDVETRRLHLLALIDTCSVSGPDLVSVCARLAERSTIHAGLMLHRLLASGQVRLPELDDPGLRLLLGLNPEVFERLRWHEENWMTRH